MSRFDKDIFRVKMKLFLLQDFDYNHKKGKLFKIDAIVHWGGEIGIGMRVTNWWNKDSKKYQWLDASWFKQEKT